LRGLWSPALGVSSPMVKHFVPDIGLIWYNGKRSAATTNANHTHSPPVWIPHYIRGSTHYAQPPEQLTCGSPFPHLPQAERSTPWPGQSPGKHPHSWRNADSTPATNRRKKNTHVARCNKIATFYKNASKMDRKQPTGAKIHVARCNKIATFHNNMSNTSMKSAKSCTSHASSITRSIPSSDDWTEIH
jgi:hypothetical protein